MDIINYLLNLVIDEEEIIRELLNIDNNLCQMNISYNDLVDIIRTTNGDEYKVTDKYDVITDGDIKSVVFALINYHDVINRINIDDFYYGINKWLVTRINEYYNNEIILDKDSSYEKYGNNIMIVGEKAFIDGVGEIVPSAIKKEII